MKSAQFRSWTLESDQGPDLGLNHLQYDFEQVTRLLQVQIPPLKQGQQKVSRVVAMIK